MVFPFRSGVTNNEAMWVDPTGAKTSSVETVDTTVDTTADTTGTNSVTFDNVVYIVRATGVTISGTNPQTLGQVTRPSSSARGSQCLIKDRTTEQRPQELSQWGQRSEWRSWSWPWEGQNHTKTDHGILDKRNLVHRQVHARTEREDSCWTFLL